EVAKHGEEIAHAALGVGGDVALEVFHPRGGDIIPVEPRAVVDHVIAERPISLALRRVHAELPAGGGFAPAAKPVFERPRVGWLRDLLAFEKPGADPAARDRGEQDERLAVLAAAVVRLAVEGAVEIVLVEEAVDRRLYGRGQPARGLFRA